MLHYPSCPPYLNWSMSPMSKFSRCLPIYMNDVIIKKSKICTYLGKHDLRNSQSIFYHNSMQVICLNLSWGRVRKEKMLNAETWYTVRFFRITYFEWILDIYWNCYVHISLPKKLKKQLSSLENEQPRL